MKKLKVGLLYLGLHNQLYKKFGNTIITRKEFFCKLGKHYMIPKNLRDFVVREMSEAELIKKIDRDRIEIMKSDINIEKDCSKIYQMAGIY